MYIANMSFSRSSGSRSSGASGKMIGSVTAAVILAAVLLAGSAGAGSLAASKKAGAYVVGIRIDRNPPVIGENHLDIEIRDDAGNIRSDAAVMVNYYMPPMPRMAPMNYRTDAKLKGGVYKATMHFIMEGPWVIAVKVTLAGKTTTAKFNVDAK